MAAAKRKLAKMEEDGEQLKDKYTHHFILVQSAQEEIEALNKERKDIGEKISKLRSSKTKKADALKEFRKVQKTDDDSLYTKIDAILHAYGIERAAYHGGDLTGGCVKNLMMCANEIMSEVAVLLIENKSSECTKTPADISKLCDDVARVLILWDGALAELHTKDPKEKDFVKAQGFMNKALKVMRSLELSITVKGHGGEVHLVDQMRSVKGGLFEFDESWTEQYHQVGYDFDMRLRNMGSEKRKAGVRAANERRTSRPEAQAAMKKLKRLKRGKRKATMAKESEARKTKLERREKAFNSIS